MHSKVEIMGVDPLMDSPDLKQRRMSFINRLPVSIFGLNLSSIIVFKVSHYSAR